MMRIEHISILEEKTLNNAGVEENIMKSNVMIVFV